MENKRTRIRCNDRGMIKYRKTFTASCAARDGSAEIYEILRQNGGAEVLLDAVADHAAHCGAAYRSQGAAIGKNGTGNAAQTGADCGISVLCRLVCVCAVVVFLGCCSGAGEISFKIFHRNTS